MKHPSGPPVLGYLAAFTLGVICMGLIVFYTRTVNRFETDPPREEPLREPGSERIHFQRANNAPRLSIPARVAPAVPPAPRSSPEFENAIQQITADHSENVQERDLSPALQPTRSVVAFPVASVTTEKKNGGRISGRALLMYRPPPETKLPLDPVCARRLQGPATTQHYVVGRDRGLANVLVMITGGLPQRHWPVPPQTVTLKLRGCRYENPVIGLQAGQKLEIVNLDPALHNVHNTPEENPETSFALLPKSRPLEYTFENPELFMRFKCDVHPWEFAYVSVFEHPFFAVTDGNGNFAIPGLPEGRYTIEAHHRKAGVLRREISIDENHEARLDFEFRENSASAQNI